MQDSLFDWIAYYYTEHPIKCTDGEVYFRKSNVGDRLQWSAYFSHCKVVLLKWLVAMGTNQDKQSNLHAIRVPYNACDRFAVVHFMHEMKDQLGLRVFDSATSSSFWADAVSVYEKAFPDVTFSENLSDPYFPKDLLCLDRNKSCIDLDLPEYDVNSDFLYLLSKDAEPYIQRGFDSLVETASLREL